MLIHKLLFETHPIVLNTAVSSFVCVCVWGGGWVWGVYCIINLESA